MQSPTAPDSVLSDSQLAQNAQADAEIQKYATKLTGMPWVYFEKLHCVLIFISSVCIVVSISAMVVMRYILDTDLFGIEEIILLASFILYFMGGAQGSFERSHITADFLEKTMARRGWLLPFLMLQRGLELIVNYVFIYWGYLMLEWSLTRWPITPVWRIPFALPQFFIAAGFLLMALYSTAHFVLVIKIALQQKRS